jgi:hypothetical protein
MCIAFASVVIPTPLKDAMRRYGAKNATIWRIQHD